MAEANDLNLAEAKTLVEEIEKLEEDQDKVTENSDLKEMVDIKVDGKWRITVEGDGDNATKKLNSETPVTRQSSKGKTFSRL